MIAIACPACGGDTAWRYPHFQAARVGVPTLPRRCYRSADPMFLEGWTTCPDPSGHLNEYRRRTETR